MALLKEAGFSCWGTSQIGVRKCSSERSMREGSCWINKGLGGRVLTSAFARPLPSLGLCIISAPAFRHLRAKSASFPRLGLNVQTGFRHSCQAKGGNEDAKDVIAYDPEGFDEDGFDKNGYDKNGRDRFGRDKLGLDEDGLDKFGIPGDAILEGPIRDPDYHTYIDPVSGDPAPTYGFRNSLPNAAFWGDDLEQIRNSSPPFSQTRETEESSTVSTDVDNRNDQEVREEERQVDVEVFSDSDVPSGRSRRAGGRRRKRKDNAAVEQSDEDRGSSAEVSEGRSANTTQLSKREKSKKGDDRDDAQESEDKEEEDVSLGKLFGGYANRGYPLISGDPNAEAEWQKENALPNEKLWWNWRQPSPEERPWSAWQKRPGDADTVMAAAMAETGQIKLFGEKPTIAEATLARARKKVFYNERMELEEERKQQIGALAYYKEWVKDYKGDTSKEAIQKQYEETGEEEGIQLLDMFAYQTAAEYRKMQGTDVRIRRDPLIMRMRPDQVKQVWGGDPVYPTVNYEQDPDEVADYRNENMHEPIPDIVEMLRESGRLITQEELKALLEKESAENDGIGGFYGLSGAVDIGEEDEEDIDEDEEEIEDFDEEVSISKKLSSPSKKKRQGRRNSFELELDLDEVEVDEEEDDVADDDDLKNIPTAIDEDDET